jgi:hypothetical protein
MVLNVVLDRGMTHCQMLAGFRLTGKGRGLSMPLKQQKLL